MKTTLDDIFKIIISVCPMLLTMSAIVALISKEFELGILCMLMAIYFNTTPRNPWKE